MSDDLITRAEAMVARKLFADRSFNSPGYTTPTTEMLRDLIARVRELEAENFGLRHAPDMAEEVCHAIRKLLNTAEVPLAAFIDDHVGNAVAQRNIATARAESAERERDAAVKAGWKAAYDCISYCIANWYQDTRSEDQRAALSTIDDYLASMRRESPDEYLADEWLGVEQALEARAEAKAARAERDAAVELGKRLAKSADSQLSDDEPGFAEWEAKHWQIIEEARAAGWID